MPGFKSNGKISNSKSNGKKSKEVWKKFPLKIYENKYIISNSGEVKNSNGDFLKLAIRAGYYSVNLCNNGISKHYKIHRMVAMAFIPNKNKANVVNHINGKKLDNNVKNLEWISRSENVKHAIENNLQKISEKRVGQYDLKTDKLINSFSSIKEAGSKTNTNNTSIVKVCKGDRKSAGGFRWKYIDDDNLSYYILNCKEITDYPNYLINDKGHIFSFGSNKCMTPQTGADGNKTIGFTKPSKDGGQDRKSESIHRLVAQYFIKKNNPDHNSIRHKNGDKSQNHKENLEWCFVGGVEPLESKYHIGKFIEFEETDEKSTNKKSKKKCKNDSNCK